MTSEAFHLLSELRGHEEDIRGCLSCEIGLVTASRDKTIKTWVEESPNTFTQLMTLVGHKDYVGPLAFVPAGVDAALPNGALVSGSRDTTVMVWDPVSGAAIATCKGHAYQVAAVAVLPSGEIVSASLDKTVRVWRPSDGSSVHVLEGHEGPVLSLAVTPTGDILSGSGDTTIRLWSGGRCTATLRGHTDTVRALAVFPGVGLVSGSHDLTLRVWDMQGNTLAELLGHTAIIYAVKVLAEKSLVASGSEDGTARIWRPSGECLQVIDHPGCVWDMCFTAVGDLMTACSDAVARMWTTDQDRKADEEIAAALQGLLDERRMAAAQKAEEERGGGAGAALPPGVKVVEAHTLLQPGAKDGETKVVKEANGGINAYAWDAKEFKWDMIGEVVAAPQGGEIGGGAQKLHDGKHWDFVFDVDAEEGAPPRKLPCNRGENPYIVADRFLLQEDLPAGYREQIVQFVLQRTAEAGPAPNFGGMSVTGGGVDPFTGGSGSGDRPMAGPGAGSFQAPAAFSATGGGVDPFTGGGGGGRGGAAGATAAGSYIPGRLLHVPARVYLAFDNPLNVDAVLRKLREFNAVLQQEGLGLAQGEETGPLEDMIKKLAAATLLTPADLALLAKLLAWPRAQLFPALDVARAFVLDIGGASALVTGPLMACLSAASSEPAVAANQQLGLRLACNCFKHACARACVVEGRLQLLDSFSSCCASTNKGVRVSMATLLYNYAVHCKSSSAGDQSETKLQVLSALIELLNNAPMDDGDSVFRALVALGTLCHEDAEMSSLAKDMGAQEALRKVHDASEASQPAGRRLLEAALDISAVLM